MHDSVIDGGVLADIVVRSTSYWLSSSGRHHVGVLRLTDVIVAVNISSTIHVVNGFHVVVVDIDCVLFIVTSHRPSTPHNDSITVLISPSVCLSLCISVCLFVCLSVNTHTMIVLLF